MVDRRPSGTTTPILFASASRSSSVRSFFSSTVTEYSSLCSSFTFSVLVGSTVSGLGGMKVSIRLTILGSKPWGPGLAACTNGGGHDQGKKRPLQPAGYMRLPHNDGVTKTIGE